MLALKRCWWCGRSAEVDTNLSESNGLIRDDSTMDGSESWICTDASACVRSPRGSGSCGGVQRGETKSAGDTTGGARGGSRLGNPSVSGG